MGGVLMFRSERMHRTGVRSTASGTSSHMQSWADCITGTLESSFWKRQDAAGCDVFPHDSAEPFDHLRVNVIRGRPVPYPIKRRLGSVSIKLQRSDAFLQDFIEASRS